MPLYDFRCRQCGERFEAFAAAGAAAACPACAAPDAERLFTPIAPPARIGLRGAAARQSDSVRKDREAARQDRIAQARKRRESG